MKAHHPVQITGEKNTHDDTIVMFGINNGSGAISLGAVEVDERGIPQGRAVTAHLNADQARQIATDLIERADELDPPATSDKLTLSTPTEVEPTEVLSMIYGTGALSYPWWNTVIQKRDGEVVEFDPALESAEARDTFVFIHDSKDGDEGAYEGRTEVTMQQIVDAAGLAASEALLDDENVASMARGEIGYLDADGADVVLQLAVFGGKSPIFG